MKRYNQSLDQIETYITEPPHKLQPQKFGIFPGQTREVVFIDNTGPSFLVHSFKVNREIVHVQCLGDDCLLCLERHRAVHYWYFSVIEIHQRVLDGQRFVDNYKKLLAAPRFLAGVLKNIRNANGLSGQKILCRHPANHFDKPGEIYQTIQRMDLNAYGDPLPYDYAKILRQLHPNKMIQLLKMEQNDSIQEVELMKGVKPFSFPVDIIPKNVQRRIA